MSARLPATATGTRRQTLARLKTQLEFKCGNGRMKHPEQRMFIQGLWHVRPGSAQTPGGRRHPLSTGGIRRDPGGAHHWQSAGGKQDLMTPGLGDAESL